MMRFLLFLSLFGVLYAYVGYGASLLLVSLFRRRVVKKEPFYPKVTLIITAHNEEAQIDDKIRNTLALTYPREALQILVVSDGSTNHTNGIVQRYGSDGVELLALEERSGKENAQKRAIEIARGEILVFSDAGTRLDPTGLGEIVFNFADPSVGCVSSEDRLQRRDGTASGEGFYVKYEMGLRNLESTVNSVVGLSGSFFAARKDVFTDFSGQMQSDFRTLLNSIKLGLRGVSDSRAIGYYLDVGGDDKEFARKIRTITRGLTVFFNHMEFLNPFRYGLFAYQYFCHKLLRWSVPFFLIVAFISNVVLARHSQAFLVLLVLQVVIYAVAIAGWLKPSLKKRLYVKIPCYLLAANLSILIAWIRFLKGERIVMWQPSRR